MNRLRVGLRHYFGVGRVYVLQHRLEPRVAADFLPRLENYELKIVHSDDDARGLVADGYEDFRLVVGNSRARLAAGAIAFCTFVGYELASLGWIALDERAKGQLDRLPYKVAFGEGEACTGGTLTVSKFRGSGLMSYGQYERLEFLRRLGYRTSKNAVSVGNTASLTAHGKFSPGVVAEAQYVLVGQHLWWRESPIRPSSHPFAGAVSSTAGVGATQNRFRHFKLKGC